MARDVNEVIVIGRLVRDVEFKVIASGTPVAKFSIANNQAFKQNDEWKEYVNYFDVTVWGKQAESCSKYLTKGKQVAVSGSLRQERWQDKTSGQNRSKVEITANQVQFLGDASKPTGQAEGLNNQQYQQNSAKVNEAVNGDPWGEQGQSDSDIPF